MDTYVLFTLQWYLDSPQVVQVYIYMCLYAGAYITDNYLLLKWLSSMIKYVPNGFFYFI